VRLEEVLVAFQKALARTAQQTANEKEMDARFLAAERVLFGVDTLEVDLNVGMAVTDDPDDGFVVGLDFAVDPERRSKVKFTVDPTPLEPISTTTIALVPLTPTRDVGTVSFLGTVVGANGKPIPGANVSVYAQRSGVRGRRSRGLEVATDGGGRIRFDVDFGQQAILIADRTDLKRDLPAKDSATSWIVWVFSKELNAGSRRIDIWAPTPAQEPADG